MEDPIIIIGAGIGGMSAAIHLAARDRRVLILEQNEHVGGKMSEHRQDGFRWDTGPSLITMLPVFKDLFAAAGGHLEDFIDLQPLDPIVRFFFANGKRLDATANPKRMAEQVRNIAPGDEAGFAAFMNYTAELSRIVNPVFVFDRPPRPASMLKVAPSDIFKFDGMRTMSQVIDSYVRSPELRQMLGLFATYVGASPYRAPATLNVIADVELNQGVWYPRGGVYSIARALRLTAEACGVEIHTNCRVAQIIVEEQKVQGVRLEGGECLPAAAVISNLDVFSTYAHLLPQQGIFQKRLAALQRNELSVSGFILLLGIQGQHPDLLHHNTLFSSDYRREFDEIFRQSRPPDEPTLYVSISARATSEDAPPGSENWFVQVNVPPLQPDWDWRKQAEPYAEKVLNLLARRGFDLRSKIETLRLVTPIELEQQSGAYRGALYGASSNSRWAAFRRPHNRAPGVRGLYFAGGTTHPGGGVPMVTLSGKVAAELLSEDGY